jgi:hypothetical protein
MTPTLLFRKWDGRHQVTSMQPVNIHHAGYVPRILSFIRSSRREGGVEAPHTILNRKMLRESKNWNEQARHILNNLGGPSSLHTLRCQIHFLGTCADQPG